MNIFFAVFLFILPIFLIFLKTKKRPSSPSHNLPPGSLGIPIIGQSLGLLWSMRANTAEKWLEERVRKYGPISKLSLFGKPTVFIYGQAANKFVFTSDSSTLANNQTQSVKMIMGDRCLLELIGNDHKRVRDALVSFLKPDCLKQYVGKMDEEVKNHLQLHWEGRKRVTVLPLIKMLTFNIICSLLIGVERGPRRDEFVNYFQQMILGMWSVPVDLPFTRYRQSLKASSAVQSLLKTVLSEKRIDFEKKGDKASHQDLVTCLLSMQTEEKSEGLSENEIIHNLMLVMVAGYDTSSVLITFVLRLFASNQTVHQAVLREQEDIAKRKSIREFLTWEDLSDMKYTWRVVLETLRIFPPIFGGFRKTLRDIDYNGYLIPKGWQIFWASHMTQMDSKIFKDPSTFDPKRFENQASVPPYCFVPFGGGPRICPGYEFARIETLVTIHYLVTRFTWELCCKDDEDSFSRDPMPTPNKGLPIYIFPKKLP